MLPGKAVTVKKSHHTFVFQKQLTVVKIKLDQMELTVKENFVQDYCNRGRDYCNRGERLNSSLIQQGQLGFIAHRQGEKVSGWKTAERNLVSYQGWGDSC